MTAEEKLKEYQEEWLNRDELKIYPARLAPQDIDLIANLVVERIMALFGRPVEPFIGVSEHDKIELTFEK